MIQNLFSIFIERNNGFVILIDLKKIPFFVRFQWLEVIVITEIQLTERVT